VDLEFMPKSLEAQNYMIPQKNKHEDVLKAYLQSIWPKYYDDK